MSNRIGADHAISCLPPVAMVGARGNCSGPAGRLDLVAVAADTLAMPQLALFDMDGTLIDADSDWQYLRYRRARGTVGLGSMVKGGWWYLEHWLGVLDADRMATRALRAFAGKPEHEHADDVVACYRALLRPRIATDGRTAIAHHRALGDRLAIITAATTHAAAPLAHELGIEHVVATELATEDGRLTGAFTPPLCHGAGKLARARGLAERLQLPLAGATFYSDSISDLPLLEAVGRPVAVNPDRRLRRIAAQRGWTIETWEL
jgi:HAD superfamily hydrolase (TIGR01490 family)